VGKKPDPNAHAPLVNAFTVGLSFFVGLMSFIVAVMALAVAGRQDNPHVGQDSVWSNDGAMRLSYTVGVLAIINGLVAFAKARLRPWVTAGCTVVFVITVVLTNALFVRAW
jgi:uncharacterized membrane protein YkgB